jgi:hypothetical protein
LTKREIVFRRVWKVKRAQNNEALVFVAPPGGKIYFQPIGRLFFKQAAQPGNDFISFGAVRGTEAL